MMERLTIDEIIEHCERKTKFYEEVGKSIDFETIELTDAIKEYWEHKQVKEYLEELKRYRDLEEQGLLLKLPCKVGDTVYALNKTKREIFPSRVEHIEYVVNDNLDFPLTKIKGEGFCVFFDDFGKIVFLTQAEAEQKLKEMESDNNGT